MKKCLILVSILVAQIASADCIRGTIRTIPGEGGAGLYMGRFLVGAIPNPRGLHPNESGYFQYDYIKTPDEPQIALLTVRKVPSCPR